VDELLDASCPEVAHLLVELEQALYRAYAGMEREKD
jgi:hypothetical protein